MRPKRHTILTSIGLVTPQGIDAATTWQNLLAGKVLHDVVGRAPLDHDGTSRVSQLAIHAAREAVAAAGHRWGEDAFANPRTAIVVGTSKGPIEDWIAQLKANEKGTSAPRQSDRFKLGLATVADDLARTFKHGYGPRLTLAAACASGLHALIRAQMLIETNVCDRVLVVASESSISDLFVASYTRLGVLADPSVGCRPFDKARQGFLMSEAAAAICIDAADRPTGISMGKSIMLSDATHLTGTDPAGRAFRDALQAVRPPDRPVDLIHAHGTGTALNDPIELAAIESTCGSLIARPAVYSHKHAIGHTQGAAGLISVAINWLSHRDNCIPPNANTPSPIAIPSAAITIAGTVTSRQQHPIATSLTLAAGFGSPIAAVSLIKINP